MNGTNGRSLVEASQRFAMALDQAIYDKQCEATQNLVYLYDADVLVEAMVGLTTWENDQAVPENVSDPLFVVRALFSVGYLPRAHLLRPHLVEIDRFVKNTRRPEKREAGSLARQLRFLIRQWGLDQHDRRMHEYAANTAALESVIRSEGFEIFVKLELCYGGLVYDRVGRILKNCALFSDTLPVHPLRPGDEFAQIVAEMLGQSQGIRRKKLKQLNNLVDGYALSELKQHVEDGAPVRFYTETVPVREVCIERLPREAGNRTVLRDAEYFLMRCSFPAVGFAHLGRSQAVAASLANHSLEQLEDLNNRLHNLLSPDAAIPAAELERALRNEQAWQAGESLAELIEDFYSLKFLKNVFLRWETPDAMKEFVPYLANFFNNEPWVNRMHAALEQSITSVTLALTDEIRQLTRWQNDVRHLRGTIRERRKDFAQVAPDPWKDMGLGRWGLNEFLPETVSIELTRWLADVADEDKPLERLASDVALRVAPDGYRDWGEFALAQCQLWSLKLYPRLVSEWEESSEEFEPGVGSHVLQVLYLVARVKTITGGLQKEPKAEIERIRAMVADAEQRMMPPPELNDPRLDGVGSMGVAHVTYWAWKRLRQLDGALALEMVEKSFDAAHRALGQFNPVSLAYAFALNHCVYVGTVGKIQTDETEKLRQESFKLHTEFRNHYRFADTRARQLTEELIQRLEEHRIEEIVTLPAFREAQEILCALVHDAKEILNNARPFFGDEEVEMHWQELVGYEGSLRCRSQHIDTPAIAIADH